MSQSNPLDDVVDSSSEFSLEILITSVDRDAAEILFEVALGDEVQSVWIISVPVQTHADRQCSSSHTAAGVILCRLLPLCRLFRQRTRFSSPMA